MRRRRLALLLVLASCKHDPPAAAVDAAVAEPVASASAAPVDAAIIPADPTGNERLLLSQWDAAYNAGDAVAIGALYASSVRWYGVTLSHEDVQAKIASYIASAPDRKQTSALDGVALLRDGARVTFTKTITLKGKTTKYPSYFHLARGASGALRIDEESDPVTDKTLAAGTCDDALSALARATSTASAEGLTTVTPPKNPGDHWVAIFYRSHGTSEIEFDPKNGAVLWGNTGSDRTPLDASDPKIRALADKVKSKCK
jgi:hypothetical protein